MSKKQRIDPNVDEVVKHISKCLRIQDNDKHYNFSETVGIISYEYLKNHKHLEIKTDITELDLRHNENYLRRQGVDTNIKPSLRDDLKTIRYFLKKEKIVSEDAELSINDIIRMVVDKYIELYPKLDRMRKEDKFLLQRIAVEEFVKQKEEEKYR